MESISVHIITDIDQAIQQLNTHHGLPKEDCISQFSAESFFTHDGQTYMHYDEYWTSILGEPIEITI